MCVCTFIQVNLLVYIKISQIPMNQNMLYTILNDTYSKLVEGVCKTSPESQTVAHLFSHLPTGDELFNQMVSTCNDFETKNNESVAELVRDIPSRVRELFQFGFLSFLSELYRTYNRSAQLTIDHTIQELFVQFTVARACADKWKYINPLVVHVQQAQEKEGRKMSVDDVTPLIEAMNGSDNLLVKHFGDAETMKHLQTMVAMNSPELVNLNAKFNLHAKYPSACPIR